MPSRRTVLKSGGSAGVAALAGCTGGGGGTPTPRVERETVVRERTVVKERTVTPEAPVELKTISPEGAAYVAAFLYSFDRGLWRNEYNIDLSLEVAPFGKYQRAIVEGLADVAGEQPTQIQFINQGEDLVFFGSELNMFTMMFAKADDDSIEDPTDLSDKVLGLPFPSSMTTVGFRAMILEEYGFDIKEDTGETTYAPPPVLWNLLVNQDEIDAMGQFSGFTVKGVGNPDLVKTVFDPYDLWIERTGRPAPITIQTAQRSWFEDNPDVALDYVRAWHDTLDLFQGNAEEAIRNYGRLGGITTENEARALRSMMADDIPYTGVMDREQVDANWEFIELLADHGVFETLPNKDDVFYARSELEDLASG